MDGGTPRVAMPLLDANLKVSESVCEAADFAALPTDSVLLLFSHLSLKDVCAAGSACASWYRCLSAVWRSRCLSRWRHWSTPPPARNADTAQWRDVYARRHQIDKHVLDLLHSTCWPAQQAEAYSTIMGYGADALDVLAAAAQASTHSGLYLGMAFHAQTALLLVQAHLATQRIKHLLAAGATPGAAADGCRASSAVSAVDSTEDVLLELALQVTQALHPLSDASAVRLIVQQLGDELTSRMKAAEVMPGSKQALDMLNALMLARPLSQWPSLTSTTSPEGSAAGSHIQQGQQNAAQPSTPDWPAVWPQLEELQGPDLHGFQMPSGSRCGLGLEGNQELLGQRSSLCLDSVLRSGTGHPVVMAVLHRAVGRRAGLDIDLVGVPDNFDSTALVLTRVKLNDKRSSSSSGSSSGVRAAAHMGGGGVDGAVHAAAHAQICAVHFSVFTSQVFGENPYRPAHHTLQSGTSSWPDGLPAMSPDGVCKALLSHLCVLVQQSSFLIHMDAQPPLLTALAIQLGVLQPKVLQPYVANILVSLLSDGGMGRLYLDILKESTDLKKMLQEELMLSSLFSPVKEPLVQHSSSRPAGYHQLGDCVWTHSPFALEEPEELSIITGWHSTGYFEVQPEWDVLMCGTQSIREPLYVRSYHPPTPAGHSNSTSADSQPRDPASPW